MQVTAPNVYSDRGSTILDSHALVEAVYALDDPAGTARKLISELNALKANPTLEKLEAVAKLPEMSWIRKYLPRRASRKELRGWINTAILLLAVVAKNPEQRPTPAEIERIPVPVQEIEHEPRTFWIFGRDPESGLYLHRRVEADDEAHAQQVMEAQGWIVNSVARE